MVSGLMYTACVPQVWSAALHAAGLQSSARAAGSWVHERVRGAAAARSAAITSCVAAEAAAGPPAAPAPPCPPQADRERAKGGRDQVSAGQGRPRECEGRAGEWPWGAGQPWFGRAPGGQRPSPPEPCCARQRGSQPTPSAGPLLTVSTWSSTSDRYTRVSGDSSGACGCPATCALPAAAGLDCSLLMSCCAGNSARRRAAGEGHGGRDVQGREPVSHQEPSKGAGPSRCACRGRRGPASSVRCAAPNAARQANGRKGWMAAWRPALCAPVQSFDRRCSSLVYSARGRGSVRTRVWARRGQAGGWV